MLLHFTKMHGLGNDFVVVDLISQRFKLRPKHVRAIANRRTGVGCDQLLIVEAPHNPEVDFTYRIYNNDGNEVEQCGNGARCFAKFVRDKKLTGKRVIKVETNTGVIELNVLDDGQVEVNMGAPVFEPEAIPFEAEQFSASYPLQAGQQTLEVGAVSMGNPHVVTVVDSVDLLDMAKLGPLLQQHSRFVEGVNAGFMEISSRENIKLRVYERGVGETLACGSGACAAVAIGRLRGLLDARVNVTLPGGDLLIEWQGQGHPVIMTGPATTVFEGQINL